MRLGVFGCAGAHGSCEVPGMFSPLPLICMKKTIDARKIDKCMVRKKLKRMNFFFFERWKERGWDIILIVRGFYSFMV